MPPYLALILSLAFSLVLVWREARRHPEVSHAVWLPCLWLLILGSRSVTAWLNMTVEVSPEQVLEDGSPLDRNVFMLLELAALFVVWRRRVRWVQLIQRNPWIFLYLSYAFLSVAWSDFPFVAFKRWFKSLGDVAIVLVLLSEVNPTAALSSVLRRCAFILLPLSITFIKYFPYLGRAYDNWSGAAIYTGVTTNKNMLGYLLFAFGLLFICEMLTRRTERDLLPARTRHVELAITVTALVMVVYLSVLADSKTALVALVAGTFTVVALGFAVVRRHFGKVALAALFVGAVLQLLFNVSALALEAAGRDATLTGRTEIWTSVLALNPSPLVGAGFQSFWLGQEPGQRLDILWRRFPIFLPNQAHNGYIEIFINLGWAGLALFIGVILACYRGVRDRLARAVEAVPQRFDDVVVAKFAMAYLIAYLLYNVTEAIFQPLNFLFIIFLVFAIDYPRAEGRVATARAPGSATTISARPKPHVWKPRRLPGTAVPPAETPAVHRWGGHRTPAARVSHSSAAHGPWSAGRATGRRGGH